MHICLPFLVAELLENGKLVGVVRGCIKGVQTGNFGESHVKMGCILGLRVSPTHRRMGIGLELVNSVEEWLLRNGAEYTFLATEENNSASMNLFTLKCSYINLSSLVIFVQQICFPAKNYSLSEDIKVEKLHIDQATSLYKQKLKDKEISPADIEAILKENPSLGTWVCYFKEGGWMNTHNNNNEKKDDERKTPSSWIIFSIWNSCAKEKIFPCLGFLFLYGMLGEGEKLGELMESVWSFASNVGQNVKDCKVIAAELGVTDPLIKHVPQESSMSRINDLWYAKKLMFHDNNTDKLMLAKGPLGDVFVDPRDF
ncbi:probable N-acetyltransferase HLS1-like isoform X2 [Corylus avellana]|uniref:probable N-acetyltransferase HLS1-like isoform X2 n=1 Tax=Corylus avellana TaxID=13451 RepID=UPI00286A2880|nr:probable N-acetyltransferase HLS1-like isoform X2 [Corylus avellana]